ncbi:MAG: hemolysin family protein [Anaerolineae bacterium]|nr:hemolysin family protein [Anaerolineae bacterium]MCO5188660.1 hemolysin family protein [Anaerolineae bacterium]
MNLLLAIPVVVATLIFINALYVAGEFATVSSRRTRLRQMAGSGDRMARQLLPILEDKVLLDRYVAACQLGITISSIVIGAYGTSTVAPLLQPLLSYVGLGPELTVSVAATIVLLGFTFLQVIFGELFPKSVAVEYPERVALVVVLPVRISMVIFRPLIWVFNGSGRLILRLMGQNGVAEHGQFHSAEEIEILVADSHEGGLLDDEERQMLRNAFRLYDLTARQVMVHRTRMISAEYDSPMREIIDLSLAEGYTRLPVYKDDIDNIVGFVHIKDVFRRYVEGRNDMASILRKVIFVPEAMPVVDVWQRLNHERQYVAIVFDEYGGTAGMITLEDLIEEIFGELQDEYDDEAPLVSLDHDGRLHLRGDLLLADVNEYLELDLPDDSADTLGGLIISVLGRQPVEGDEINVNGRLIQVEKVEDIGVAEVSLMMSEGYQLPKTSEWEVEDE